MLFYIISINIKKMNGRRNNGVFSKKMNGRRNNGQYLVKR